MIVIGEKLNSSIPRTREALARRDEAALVALMKAQQDCGADFLDINTALSGTDEAEDMLWLIGLAMEHTDCGLMLDSPDPVVIRRVIPAAAGRAVIVNSVSLGRGLAELTPVLAGSGAAVVALPMDGAALPVTASERVENAGRLIAVLTAAGISPERIYIDALVEAVASGGSARVTLETVAAVKKAFPSVRTLCGLSNVSFGLPGRSRINAAFLSMAMAQGLDSAILDITSPPMRDALYAAAALTGEDEYCLKYIRYSRSLG